LSKDFIVNSLWNQLVIGFDCKQFNAEKLTLQLEFPLVNMQSGKPEAAVLTSYQYLNKPSLYKI